MPRTTCHLARNNLKYSRNLSDFHRIGLISEGILREIHGESEYGVGLEPSWLVWPPHLAPPPGGPGSLAFSPHVPFLSGMFQNTCKDRWVEKSDIFMGWPLGLGPGPRAHGPRAGPGLSPGPRAPGLRAPSPVPWAPGPEPGPGARRPVMKHFTSVETVLRETILTHMEES